MFSKIAAFEARYQFRSPLFWVTFALFFLLTFAATTVDQIQIGSAGQVFKNAPFALLQTVGIMNLFGIFVVTAFVANAVIRDDETGFAPILRATRVGKSAYVLGRFSGATLVAAAVMVRNDPSGKGRTRAAPERPRRCAGRGPLVDARTGDPVVLASRGAWG
jgi:ABC-type transport system involved in multi-copper enzyme maturation permease subunit